MSIDTLDRIKKKINLLGYNMIAENGFGIAYRDKDGIKIITLNGNLAIYEKQVFEHIKFYTHFIVATDANKVSWIYSDIEGKTIVSPVSFKVSDITGGALTSSLYTDDKSFEILIIYNNGSNFIFYTSDNNRTDLKHLMRSYNPNIHYNISGWSYDKNNDMFKIKIVEDSLINQKVTIIKFNRQLKNIAEQQIKGFINMVDIGEK